MTEKPQPLSTQIAIPSQNLLPAAAPVPSHDVPHKAEAVEEEPYTIRCICNFSDDDGNTIYCETCDTWQHIDCYYPDTRDEALREDFAHSCAVCKPRPLDRQRAIERTQRLRSAVLGEPIDKKPTKRPPSKSHKKKPKPTDLLLNGTHIPHDVAKHVSPNEQPHPAKKPKHSHKPSQSSNAHPAKRSPSYSNPRTNSNGHPPSPATTPPDLPSDFEIHNYSDGFLSLYNESAVRIVDYNAFASLTTSNTMSLWLREPDRMRPDTGQEYGDVFQPMPESIDAKKPSLHVKHKKVPLTADTVLRWQYLTTPTAIEKNVPLAELNGMIGFQKDYCADAANMWEELTSPLPFVFFHPLLPLYIDTRKEGSVARYVRRSCKPNAMLETFLAGGTEYRFWLVSDRYIAANEQITLPWDFRFPKKQKARVLRLIGLGDEEVPEFDEPDMDETEYQHIAGWVYRILSEYGGCACDLGSNCAFTRFHRRYHGKSLARSSQGKKRSRKPKQSHAISPTSTGQATNSRAPSEGHLDDGQDDARSTSGSSHGKAPSRDMTPAPRQGSFDTFTAILTEPTSRDKRKVAMVEDQFRAMEQPKPKKKRVSDGAVPPTKPKPAKPPSSKGAGQTNGGGHYVDASTSRSKSGSPSSAISSSTPNPFKQSASRQASAGAHSRQPSVGPRPTYCNAAVQTDPVEGEWYSEPCPSPSKPRRIISLSRRLLNSRHQIRLDAEERRHSQASLASPEGTSAMDVDTASVADTNPSLASPVESEKQTALVPLGLFGSGDVVMADALSTSPTIAKPPQLTLAPPASTATSPVKLRSPDLRVQMPPVPTFGGAAASTISTATTPLSATGSTVQSPFSTNLPSPFVPTALNGITAHQSPVRKKLSLSDYRKSKVDKTAAGKPGPTALKTSTSNLDEPKLAMVLDSVMDSPTAEKAAEGVNGTTTTTATAS